MPAHTPLLDQVDHLVYAAPDLDDAVDDLERRLGVRASPGGRHPGRGTHNALLALGPASYLEIIALDPAQPKPESSPWFGVDASLGPRLVTCAARRDSLAGFVLEAARSSVTLGPVRSGSRRRPDGATLSWEFTDPTTVVADGVVPFFIDWGSSPHPATTAAWGVELVGFRSEHPQPDPVREMLLAVGLDLRVDKAPRPALIATLRTPAGQMELR